MKISYIRLLFDYPCYPVWLYDEEGMCIDTVLSAEWQNDSELDDLFIQLQDAYNALFIDNENEFSYVGFGCLMLQWSSHISKTNCITLNRKPKAEIRT